MKKEILLPTVAWLGGVAGFALRRWELATAYDPELRLMQQCPATWMLWALGAVLLVLFSLSCLSMGREKRSPAQWFYMPRTGYMTMAVCAGFLLMITGLVGFWQQRTLYHKEPVAMLCYVLCLVGGVCVLMMGQAVYRGRWSRNTPVLVMGPSFCTLVWLVATYQENARQPEVGLFVWQILSACAVVLALYGMVTLAIGKGGAGRTCVFTLMGISLSAITLADGHDLADTLLYLFAMIYLTAQAYLLLGPTPAEQSKPEE